MHPARQWLDRLAEKWPAALMLAFAAVPNQVASPSERQLTRLDREASPATGREACLTWRDGVWTRS